MGVLVDRTRDHKRGQLPAVWIAAATVALSGSVTSARARGELDAFLTAYRCVVLDSLERIHAAGDPSGSRDRVLAISLDLPSSAYVQCMFFAYDTRMYCEASSGFYELLPGEQRVHPAAGSVPALAALGFSTDPSNGNYSREIALGSPPDLGVAADFMSTALHDGYGATPSSPLKLTAPLASALEFGASPAQTPRCALSS